MKLLLDETYPATLAEGLREAGIDAHTVTTLGLRGSSDPEVFAAAVAGGYTVLTENVGDFAHIAAEYSTAGGHHAAEFREWRWERWEALPALVVPFKRPVYTQVVAWFAPLAAQA